MSDKNSEQKKYTILVIEDDKYLADIYATKLKLEGFNVEVANDGESGVEAAKKLVPDLILLDIMLPAMDGFSVLSIIKTNKKTKGITVIMLTNLNSPDDVKKGLELGAADYMVKAHFVPAEIVNKVKNILKISNK
jgi:DNA-binding response OmpR family regulator